MDISGKIPQHVAIIMDGNGRWALQNSLARKHGHEEGVKVARRIAEHAAKRGLPYLSFFIFSTENWRRAQEEVSFLFFLLRAHLNKEYDFYKERQIRLVFSGNLEALPHSVQKEIQEAKESTQDFEGRLTINLAINYGGRDEITRAVNRAIQSRKVQDPQWCEKNIPLTQKDISQHLDQNGLPDVDLLIRTSGEVRVSHFLTWQTIYSELFFSSKLWPDWTEEDFDEALRVYQKRSRRFGG